MTQAYVVAVVGADGIHGTIDTILWPLDGSKPEVLVQLDDGGQFLVPLEALSRQGNGGYVLNLSTSELEHRRVMGSTATGQSWVVPVMVEELDVQKHKIETGRVRISKVVREHEELVDEPLLREEVIIERVPINRFVEEAIPLRSEGDTIIVSLLEEVPVVEKRLMLKEELRITIRRVKAHKPTSVTLRSEEATVEHIAPKDIHGENPEAEEKRNG
jgi:uncharacterized protein (TIGR02271 family)